MKKFLLSFGILLAAVGAGLIAVITIASRDIPPPDVADLAVVRPNVLPEDNAYTYFVAATNSVYWPTNSTVVKAYLEGTHAADDVLAEIIEKNEESLGLLKRGAECPRCITPEVTGIYDQFFYVSPWLNMGRVLAAKTKMERLANRYSDATDTCLTLLQVGNLVQADGEVIIHYLVGMTILNMGLAQAQDLARDNGASLDDLKRLDVGLRNLGPFAPGLERAIKGEFKISVHTIDQIRDGKFGIEALGELSDGNLPSRFRGRQALRYFFQPNKTKQLFAAQFRAMLHNAPLRYADMQWADVEEALGLNAGRIRRLAQPNSVGRLLCGLLIPALQGAFERKCRAECDVAATRILIACNAYRSKEGRLPANLQLLVPDYLESIPVDPYDGKPFRYNPSAGVIYSVGKDLKDSGGSATSPHDDIKAPPPTRRWKAEDAVYEIEEKGK
jgi:hypothetical protein